MRRAEVMIGLVIAACAAWLLFGPETGTNDPLRADEEAAGDDRAPTLRSGRGAQPPKPASSAKGTDPAPASDPEESEQERIPPGKGQTVRGTVVLVDDEGVEHPVPKGTLKLTIWNDHTGWDQTTAVVDGAWTVYINRNRAIEPNALTIEGRHAYFPDLDDPLPVPASGAMRLRATLAQPTWLRVVDAETHADLTRVHIVRMGWRRTGHAHPGSLELPMDPDGAQRSPVALVPSADDMDSYRIIFHAWSPGYAWERAVVSFQSGGEHLVRLRKGGGLDITLAGYQPPASAVLRIRADSGGRVVSELKLAGHTSFVLDGLARGTYRAQVEVGRSTRAPRILGAAPANVVAGSRAAVTLDVGEFRPPARVPYAGELLMPAGWPNSEPEGLLWLLDAPLHGQRRRIAMNLEGARRMGEGTRAFAFDAGLVQPGAYKLRLSAIGYVARIVVEAPGTRRARIEIPPPVRVVVRTHGDEDYPKDPVGAIVWHAGRPPGVTSYSPTTVERDPKTELFEFLAPEGIVEFGIAADGYYAPRTRKKLTRPTASVTLEVTRTASVLLRAEVGGRPIAWVWDWPVKVKAADGEDVLLRERNHEKGFRLEVEKPGRYMLEVGPIPGYEAPDARAVAFVLGDPPVVVVPLVKKR